jgi:hypothetical protein
MLYHMYGPTDIALKFPTIVKMYFKLYEYISLIYNKSINPHYLQ